MIFFHDIQLFFIRHNQIQRAPTGHDRPEPCHPKDSLPLFHDDHRAVQFRFGEAVVAIALGHRFQTVLRNAVLVDEQVVDVLHTLLTQLLVEGSRTRRLVGTAVKA